MGFLTMSRLFSLLSLAINLSLLKYIYYTHTYMYVYVYVCNIYIYMRRTSQVALVEKNLIVNARDARDAVLIPGFGKSPEVKKWQPIPVLLHGKFHRQWSLVGYIPRSCKESDMTKHLSTYMYMCVCVNQRLETSLVVHWLRLQASNAGAKVQPLVRELDPMYHT